MAAKVWDLLDIVILVALLDFCIERKIDFQADVIKLLRESRKQRTGQEYPFTIKQVEGKLIDLSRNDSGRHLKDYPRLDEIYNRGSGCFPRQTNELRLQIDLALEQLRELAPHLGSQEARRSDRGANTPNIRGVHSEEESELPDQWIAEVSSTLAAVLNTVSVLQADQSHFLESTLTQSLANLQYLAQSLEQGPSQRHIV